VIRVEELLKEVNTHQVPVDQLRIDPAAMVVSSQDLAAEELLQAAIGSTRQGVGSATARKVMRVEGEIGNWRPARRAGDHPDLAQFIRPTMDILEEAYRSRRRIQLEGTQGTLLSLHHGAFPYVTSRDTTVAGCLSEAGIATSRVRRVVMTCRTYPIRVRNPDDETSGPMGKEIGWDVISSRSGIPEEELRKAEHTTTTNKLRRVAEFSWESVRLAALLNGPTDIALTFVDYIRIENRSARRFGQLTKETQEFVEAVEQLTNAPVSLIAKDFSMSPIMCRGGFRRRHSCAHIRSFTTWRRQKAGSRSVDMDYDRPRHFSTYSRSPV
jgi:adenylosuccinate synthase